MENKELNAIYEQLHKIEIHVEPRSIPNPRYISEKIGQCHVCIEQVEKIYIKANQELSLLQVALNNSLAAFEIARDDLISNDPEISILPSDRSREARANLRLREQINELNGYKRDILSLETLIKTLNVKMKNLSRANVDIKMQMRLMESQIKLGTGDINDPTTKSIMDELKKTVLGRDVWEGADTKGEENITIDPSKPLDAQALGLESDPLADFEKTISEIISAPESPPSFTEVAPNFNDLPVQGTFEGPALPEVVEISEPVIIQEIPIEESLTMYSTDPIFILSDTPAINTLSIQIETPPNSFGDLLSGFDTPTPTPINNVSKQEEPKPEVIVPKVEVSKTLEEMEISEEDITKDFFLPEDDILGLEPAEEEVEEESRAVVDLDKVLNNDPIETSNPKPGGDLELIKEQPIINESIPKETQKEEQKNPNDMSISMLLSQFK